ncbi:MAG: hypothetical protein J6Q73_04325 [Bacteroidaceae bacterium]|nr:hypothetical protein [Bacteroidaceae bacterium]
MKRIVLTIFCAILTFAGMAQNTCVVKGMVMNTAEEPLSGVTIQVPGYNKSVLSSSDGRFEIEVPFGVEEIQASKEDYFTSRAVVDGTYIIFKLKFDKKSSKNKIVESNARRDAELEARLQALENAKTNVDSRKQEVDDYVDKKESEEKYRAELEAKIRAELEAEAKMKAEIEAKIRAEMEMKAKAEAAARAKAEEEARLKAEAEARAKAEEARLKAEAEARAKAEEEARLKVEAEVRAKVAEEARLKAEAEARAKAEEEARLKAEAEARAKAEEEARLKAEAEARAKAEEARLKAEAEARAKAEEEARLKAEAEARAKAEEEARLKAEAEARAKAEEEARLKAEADARAKAEEEAKLKAETEARVKAEEEARLKAEADACAKAEETSARAKVVAQVKPGQQQNDAIDLGLPSRLKWASCNIGASSPEECGDYFAWGEIDPKSNYSEFNSITHKKRMKSIIGDGNYDVATAKLGKSWYTPSSADFEELINNCTWEWTTVNDVNGYKVTGPNGNSIFLPATGYRDVTSYSNDGKSGEYWSSTPHKDTQYSYYFCYTADGYYTFWNCRYVGRCVRPVKR